MNKIYLLSAVAAGVMAFVSNAIVVYLYIHELGTNN